MARAVSAVSDWRWLRGREDTPWYARHRLFRQRELGDWGELFGRMAGELEALAAVRGRGRGGSALVETGAGELLDRLSIVRLKCGRFRDEAARTHALREREAHACNRCQETFHLLSPPSVSAARLLRRAEANPVRRAAVRPPANHRLIMKSI